MKHLSEGHSDGLWDAWERLGLRVVFQEDAVALENHIWPTINHQRALKWLKAHCVSKLPTISRHLVATWWKEKLISTRVNSGKVFHPHDSVGEVTRHPCWACLWVQTGGSKAARCAVKCSLFTWQHVEAWLSGTERAERSSSTNTSQFDSLLSSSLLSTLLFLLSPYLLGSSQAAPSSRCHWGHWRRSGRQLQRSPSGRCLQR